ncbi:MAG: ClbS/DfsB family four-helix bundle protein [Anaerolineales bacterium]|jgi:hypothetical protein
MQTFTLRDVMRVLEEGWGEYINQFNRLSPEERAAFLEKEGFANFHDLLAHVIGWWEEGLRIITGILDDPSFTWQERDIDAYNLELIEKFRSWREEDLLLHYENVREAFLNLIADLPENALVNEDIRYWLYEDVIEHLEDHKIV